MAVTIKDKKRQSKAALAKMRQKAKRLERMPEMLVKLGPAKWKAFSETSKMAYIIVLSTAGIVCGCPASQNGLRLCKHVVELDIRLNRLWNKSRKKIDIKKIAIRCQMRITQLHLQRPPPPEKNGQEEAAVPVQGGKMRSVVFRHPGVSGQASRFGCDRNGTVVCGMRNVLKTCVGEP